jgi:hypothetical protein
MAVTQRQTRHFQSRTKLLSARIGLFGNVVFPDTNDAPAETAKFTRHLTVTLAIPSDFSVPKFTV